VGDRAFDAIGKGNASHAEFLAIFGFFWARTTLQASAMRDSSKSADLGILGG
jgi:hypothetical protein